MYKNHDERKIWMSYAVIKNSVSERFEEKKSIFIGNIKRVYDEEGAKNFIAEIKGKNPQAKHNIYAYIIGKNSEVQRYSDDGEPQGTGGIPVLEVIARNEISDTAIVVTRYFGGILLGKGGLARAYSKVAAMATLSGQRSEKVMAFLVSVTIEYELLGKIEYLFEKEKIQIEDKEYTENVKLIVLIKKDDYTQLESLTLECTSGKCSFDKGKPEYYLKFEDKIYKDEII